MFNQAKIIVGDNRKTIAKLEAGSVQTCITSPPYWGLRDYGTATWLGGDESCDHLGKPMATRANVNSNTGGRDVKNADYREPMGQVCTKCGATREDDQIGLEQTPDEYVEQLCLVFDEVWRVLADDGTLWLNLGDSYASFRDGKATPDTTRGTSTGTLVPKGSAANRMASSFVNTQIKHKDLVGIPWRVAFALQARGWYLRSEIIWHKPNPMPESVTDRPTKSHEHIFLLSKSAKYFYNSEAIREEAETNIVSKILGRGGQDYAKASGAKSTNPQRDHSGGYGYVENGKRNKRDVWTIPTQPYAGAHFAVYPTALIEPCVLAGSREGDTIIDPFSGSGTTGVVALRNGRNYVGTELNPEYAALSKQRIGDDCGMFGDVEVIGETE
jgi:DNA modification methylase